MVQSAIGFLASEKPELLPAQSGTTTLPNLCTRSGPAARVEASAVSRHDVSSTL
jgi:hypothetical protein